ncbi:MAG: 4-hydroxyphenylacetate 3-hydroxylase C-terminal domain-containing protein, partial [Candidatus Hodarchaeales archaeon]
MFDDVHIPTEHIYLKGEVEFTGELVNRFAGYHRQSYACKTGVGDVLIGAATLCAQHNGVDRASHIRDKLVE